MRDLMCSASRARTSCAEPAMVLRAAGTRARAPQLAGGLRDPRRPTEDRAAGLLCAPGRPASSGRCPAPLIRMPKPPPGPRLELGVGEVRHAVRAHAACHGERLRLGLGRSGRRREAAVRKIGAAGLHRGLEGRAVDLDAVDDVLFGVRWTWSRASRRSGRGSWHAVRAHAAGERERLPASAALGPGTRWRRRCWVSRSRRRPGRAAVTRRLREIVSRMPSGTKPLVTPPKRPLLPLRYPARPSSWSIGGDPPHFPRANARAGSRGSRRSWPRRSRSGCGARAWRWTSRWTAPRALRQAAIYDYDVIVLDRDLPGVHGDRVCETLVERGGRAPGC